MSALALKLEQNPQPYKNHAALLNLVKNRKREVEKFESFLREQTD